MRVDVEEDERQRPVSLALRHRRLKVISVDDLWEISDEWWRAEPIARRYYRLTVEDGPNVTVFHDLANGGWYRQQV